MIDQDKLILAAVIKEIGEKFGGGWRVFVKRETTESIGPEDGLHFIGDNLEKEGEWIVYLPRDASMRIEGDVLHASHMIGDKSQLRLQENAGHGETERDVESEPVSKEESRREDPIL